MRLRKTLFSSTIVLAMAAAPALAQAPSVADDSAGGEAPFTLGTSDVIRVSVWNESELTVNVMVRPDGKISLPLVGEMDAAGRTAAEVEEEITDRLAVYYRDAPPVVVVIVDEINSRQFSVLGEVGAPGRFVMLQQLTILDAIALAGGFTQFADRDEVTVLRREGADGRPIKVNLKRLLEGSEPLFFVRPADTVYVR